jgi:predicted PurR-regulated permease PerM
VTDHADDLDDAPDDAAGADPSGVGPGDEREHRAWRPRGWTSGRALPLAVGIAAGILAAHAAEAMFAQLRGLITVVVISLFLSFGIEPAVQYLARRGMPRGLATGLVFVVVLVSLGGFLAVMAGLLVAQVAALVASGPELIDALAAQLARLLPGEAGADVAAWVDEQQRLLPRRLADGVDDMGRGALGLGQTLAGALLQVATVALVTFYLAADGPRLRAALARRMPPAQQVRVLGLWELAIAKTGGYIYSRALTAIVSALFHVVVFRALDLDFAVALGVWVGVVSSLIPAVGTYLAGALPLIVALATDARTALWVLAALTAYQQVENYLIVPRITATTLELHPAVAFLSVLGGGALAGAPGAILAIPAVAIATALLSSAGEGYEVLAHHLIDSGRPGAAELVDRADTARARARVRGNARARGPARGPHGGAGGSDESDT